ncbi:MAG: hypothetical protein SPG40_09045 [Kiritimatiellia bacterium]|nr:hypothetical protein [Kiritimatiellia bacterium]
MSEDVEMKPIAPEEVGDVPPKVDLSAVASAPAASTVKLKPIIRRPVIRKPVIGGAKPVVLKPASGVPPAPAAVPEAAAEVKKSEPAVAVKPVQDAMPAQAILHKTGIIAEGILTPAQAQAAKTKTSRISLESAIGVAPTLKSGAPMKTIKLRRLTDIPPAPGAVKIEAGKPASAVSPLAPASTPAEAPAPATPVSASAESVKADVESVAEQPLEKPATMTQKKTLKLHRPGFKRPTVSGLKRPGASAVSTESKPASDSEVADLAGDVPVLSPEIADIKPMPSVADLPDDSTGTVAGVPSWLNISTILAGVAALVVMSLCTWTLFREATGPSAGPNDLATFHSDTDYRR